ncbi:thioredoxin family protein [Sulfurimonas sediminis]|uniref:thioredoxin family protein n=1 Tax=Sulfurimonas sediminis TaxID=2590020 RepID=UPI0018676A23|nr:thioredoxin family protein [Sulfurimonas sediminis]
MFELEGFTIENSYNTAQYKALKSNKILLVFLTKKGCSACNKALMKMINSKRLTSLIEKNAVFVLVYRNQEESFPIEMLYTTQYPTLFFLDREELFTCKALRGNINITKTMDCLHP